MTVMALPEGGLALHSSLRLDAARLAELVRLGEPRLLLVPNALHGSEAWFYAERFPDARVLVPAAARERVAAKVPRIDGTLEADWPAGLAAHVAVQPLAGTSFAEAAFLHVPSRTLVLTDLCFNLAGADLPTIPRLLMRLNDGVDRFGPTRLARTVFIRDRRALAESLAPVLAWDFDRVVVSHGRILESGGQAAMRQAFGFLTG